MEGYTNFTKVHADEFNGPLVGNAETANSAASLTGSVVSINTISKDADYELVAAEKAKFFTSITMTAASKTLTLGLVAGQSMIVYNAGSETLTVKNVADDTGTSLAKTKAILIVGSDTADASIVIALN